MKTLLVYPEYPDTFWSFKHALKFIGKRAALPPLGLLTVGAMLPKEWPKRLVDENVTKLDDTDLAWADWVFISGMVLQRASARKIIARFREQNLKVIAYAPEPYYKRAMTFLREYKAPKVTAPLNLQRLLAVFRSSVRLGIFGEERFQYWKIML